MKMLTDEEIAADENRWKFSAAMHTRVPHDNMQSYFSQAREANQLWAEWTKYLDLIAEQKAENERLRELPAKIISGMQFIYDEHCASVEEARGMKLIMGQVKRTIEAALEETK